MQFKTTSLKWILYNHIQQVGRITYGSPAQLRSSVINLGAKKLYIVDLPRARSEKDSSVDLLTVLEEIKSGCVTNPMYGKGNTLIMDPPHVLVSSNSELETHLLSEDRWEIYQITSRKRLKNITKQFKQKQKQSEIATK